jgi:hypothetical protein
LPFAGPKFRTPDPGTGLPRFAGISGQHPSEKSERQRELYSPPKRLSLYEYFKL